ncbi:DUF1758 domain-containing protein [Nephila pilipes]|uniref:DUF1758 domain-containing protein n=1 Tax=Nephila pilipes TaxID=299642 RepID=A0A8X6NS63_NEPPI|nr:DUF1758 domain-containing protein [Nephila pilipes]GFT30029.1 DUF1758 domain-containing protein [Nephila pilipes]GFT38430.1 DUF1758 domain-containing protein [Nephila pilipes]GFT44477.1 DUF1758 domain-containing protein [Nephila pilipes]GFT73731.1 DUF1758 domain-containing protein [Nephila pilipes]
MAVVVALNRKRDNLKDQLTKLLSAITDEETMDILQLETQLEILKKVQKKFEILKEDYYKSASDEEYLTIDASLSEIDQEIQHLEVLDFERDKLSNVLFLNIILEKLERESHKQYELTLKDNEVSDLDEFLNWLERRNQILNSINSHAVVKLNQGKPKSFLSRITNSLKIAACVI